MTDHKIQHQLMEHLKVNRSTVWRWEKHDCAPLAIRMAASLLFQQGKIDKIPDWLKLPGD